MTRLALFAAAISVLLGATASAAISTGSVDSFDTDAEGWRHGQSNPSQPTWRLGLGPAGPGDNVMGFRSTGTGGPGNRFLAFTTDADWTGDYVSAGVDAISLDVNNGGARNLNLRIAFNGSGGSYVTPSQFVASGGGWQSLLFPIAPTDLQRITGSSDAATVMGSVTRMYLLSANSLPSTGSGGQPQGDRIVGQALFDNITAIDTTAVPEPGATFVLLSVAGLVLVRRRSR